MVRREKKIFVILQIMSEKEVESLLLDIPSHLLIKTFKRLSNKELIKICTLSSKGIESVCQRPELRRFWRNKLRTECDVYQPCDEQCFRVWLERCSHRMSPLELVEHLKTADAYPEGVRRITDFTLDRERIPQSYTRRLRVLFPNIEDIASIIDDSQLRISQRGPSLLTTVDVPVADTQRIETIASNEQGLNFDEQDDQLEERQTLTSEEAVDLLSSALIESTTRPPYVTAQTADQLEMLKRVTTRQRREQQN